MNQQGPKSTADLRPQHLRSEQPESGERVPIFVDPRVDPAAAAYAAGAAARQSARKRGLPPKYTEPAGGERVAIPRLDAQHQVGMTMAEQAAAGGPSQQELLAATARQVAQNPGSSIVEPPIVMGGHRRVQPPEQRLGLRPDDMLPEDATKDPHFMTGTGSMYAMSQPALAAKYGVIRGGQHVPPQLLANAAAGGARSSLRPETLKDLQDIENLRSRQGAETGLPQTDEEAENMVREHPAAHSSRAGSTLQEKELSDEEQDNIRAAIKGLDSFDYDKLQEAMNRDILNNPEQQKIIEARLEEIDVDELIIRNKVSQEVPIIPNRFIVTFESMTGEEDVALKRLIMQESKSVEVNNRYLLDKFAFMSIACGLKAINKNPLPSHLDEKGNFDDEKFWLKFNWVLKRPIHMLASIGVNHTWFEMRVRRLFVAKKS